MLLDSTSYRNDLVAEYAQTKKRRDDLHTMLVKWEAGTLDFEPASPRSLLTQQQRWMDEYLRCLEVRAELEQIDLT